MKGCELCTGIARMYCESDQASLCFDCDAKVHGANFLVARHSRVLLCRSCQDLTPWKAEGARLGPTVSVCERCVGGGGKKGEGEDEGESEVRERVDEDDADDVDDDDNDADDDDVDEDEIQEEEEEEEGEEQVVPLSTEEAPPPVASSSSSEEEEAVGPTRNGNGSLLMKRMRSNVFDLNSSPFSPQDQLPCSSASRLSQMALLNQTRADDEVTSESFRPSKEHKRSDLIHTGSHHLSFGSARPPI